jgi:RNA recognition motif-containing protein
MAILRNWRDPVQKTLYIGNFSSRQDAGEVERLVSRSGSIVNFRMMTHRDIIRRHGGFAIVELETQADAVRVAQALHGKSFHKASLEVRAATAREESASGHPRMFGTMNIADDVLPPTNV